MFSFIVTGMQPRSANASGRASIARLRRWQRHVQSFFRPAHPRVQPLEGDLYAIVYYFHGRPIDRNRDADNLSKPILDALNGLAYLDDRQVKVRKAGIFDLSAGFGLLDMSGLSQRTSDDLISAVNQEDHTVYVEIGRLHYSSHFRFGLEVQP